MNLAGQVIKGLAAREHRVGDADAEALFDEQYVFDVLEAQTRSSVSGDDSGDGDDSGALGSTDSGDGDADGDVTGDGDGDMDLLRAITWGDGLWVASGRKWGTSTDGVTWTDHGLPSDGVLDINCGIIEGLAFADGYFFAACPEWEQPGAI